MKMMSQHSFNGTPNENYSDSVARTITAPRQTGISRKTYRYSHRKYYGDTGETAEWSH